MDMKILLPLKDAAVQEMAVVLKDRACNDISNPGSSSPVFSEQRFKLLVQDGGDLIGILDFEGNYTYVSPTSTSVLGIAPEEFIGKNAFSFIHSEDKGKVQRIFENLQNVKQVSIEPFRFLHKNGNWR